MSPIGTLTMCGAAALAALLSGCASHPVPELQLAASRGAIAQAASHGVRGELALANTKIALAQRLSGQAAQEPARWLAEQAEVDAQLAQARIMATRAVEEARRWQTVARAL